MNQPFDARPQDLPVKAELARLRVRYHKDSRLAYLGHLDLISTIERCVRRSGLPFSIGNGFARRMRVQFSGALPTGTSSSCELFDLRLTEEVDPREALERLRRATPAALAPREAAYVPGRLPALEAWLDRSSWEVELEGDGIDAASVLSGIELVRAEGVITFLRGDKEKHVDVAFTLVGASAASGEGSGAHLVVETRSGSGGSLRPHVLLDAAVRRAGLPAPDVVRVRRTGQWHEEDGRLVEPFGPFCTPGPTPLS